MLITLRGKYCINKVSGTKVPILPASFVGTEVGTGVVMSVPSHAPYDYAALRDIQKDPQKYGVSPDIVKDITPISLIKVQGFGEHPNFTPAC